MGVGVGVNEEVGVGEGVDVAVGVGVAEGVNVAVGVFVGPHPRQSGTSSSLASKQIAVTVRSMAIRSNTNFASLETPIPPEVPKA